MKRLIVGLDMFTIPQKLYFLVDRTLIREETVAMKDVAQRIVDINAQENLDELEIAAQEDFKDMFIDNLIGIEPKLKEILV